MCSANVSVKELSKANLILLSANRDHPNRPAVLTCRAEGSGRNSASSPKIKSGGSSGYWALKMISPEIKENVRLFLFPCKCLNDLGSASEKLLKEVYISLTKILKSTFRNKRTDIFF